MDARGKRKKPVAIALTLVAVLLLSGTVTYFYFNSEEDEGYLTVDEAIKKGALHGDLPDNTTFNIRDRVIRSNIFSVPKVEKCRNYMVYLDNIDIYTVVYFESSGDFPLIFSGDRSNYFKEGNVVEFKLNAERHITGCNDTSDSLSCIDPVYNRELLMNLITSIELGHFSFVSLDVNNTGNGSFIMAVNDLFLPTNTPISWSTVTFTVISEDSWTEVNPELQLFSAEGEFLGNIEKERNYSMDKEIEVGDYIVVKNITSNTTLYVWGDAFSSFDAPVQKPGFNDFFRNHILACMELKPHESKE